MREWRQSEDGREREISSKRDPNSTRESGGRLRVKKISGKVLIFFCKNDVVLIRTKILS